MSDTCEKCNGAGNAHGAWHTGFGKCSRCWGTGTRPPVQIVDEDEIEEIRAQEAYEARMEWEAEQAEAPLYMDREACL